MSTKHISTISLLLLCLFSAPLIMAHYDEDSKARDSEPSLFDKTVKTTKETTEKFFNSLYRKAQAAQPGPNDYEKSCVVLDDEVTMLLPLTYRYVPGFYDDPYNAVSVWMGTTGALAITAIEVLDVPLWYGYLGFSGYKRYAEEERIYKANMRIEALRRVKARKRCFEVF